MAVLGLGGRKGLGCVGASPYFLILFTWRTFSKDSARTPGLSKPQPYPL